MKIGILSLHSLLATLIFGITTSSMAQSPSSSICTWKGDMRAAYTLTHDDFGLGTANGIENYADTITDNRGIHISFGAIIDQCSASDWAKATEMINKGHEIMNHSWTHRCGNPSAGAWCDAFGIWDETDFWLELDSASNVIERQTGQYPRVFIFPFDQYIQSMVTHLRSLDYLGSRTGTYNGQNSANVSDPFEFAFWVYSDNSSPFELNMRVDQAISSGGWAVRELHGVQDGSWGVVSESDYRDHINYLVSQRESGDLWTGTSSRVISYIMQRNNYTTQTQYNSSENEIRVSWSGSDANFRDDLMWSPLTVKVDLDGATGSWTVVQNGQELEFTVNGDNLMFDAFPRDGEVIINELGCNNLCLVDSPQNTTANVGSSAQFTVNVTGQGPFTYQWFVEGTPISNSNSATLTIDPVELTSAGEYHAEVSNSNTSITSSSANLTVYNQQPFNGLIPIPGKIEMEDYDIGGAGISFVDGSAGNQGGEYRSDDVDIETSEDVNGGYNVGWTTAGEWLEYSVDVSSTGLYDFEYRVATNTALGGNFYMEIDGIDVTGVVAVPNTGGWQTWESVDENGIYITQGEHVIRFFFMESDINFDFSNVTLVVASNSVETSPLEAEVTVFPNPFSDHTTIQLEDGIGSFNLKLVDHQGKVIQEMKGVQNEKIDLGVDLPNGVYYIHLTNQESFKTVKLLKLD